MCQKCVRRLKNLGKPKTGKAGLVRALVYQVAQHRCASVPLFCERAANFAIEAGLDEVRRARTRRRDRRKGRRVDHDQPENRA